MRQVREIVARALGVRPDEVPEPVGELSAIMLWALADRAYRHARRRLRRAGEAAPLTSVERQFYRDARDLLGRGRLPRPAGMVTALYADAFELALQALEDEEAGLC